MKTADDYLADSRKAVGDNRMRLLHEEQEANRLLRERVRELEKKERDLQQVYTLIDERINFLNAKAGEYKDGGAYKTERDMRTRADELVRLKIAIENKITGGAE